MLLFLAHHGDAVSPVEDPQRPLSQLGRAQVDRLSSQAAERGVRPAAIWHSGKLRARQTAEAYWRACNPLADFSAARWMQPDDPPRIADLLLGETRDIMLAGHMPHLDRLLQHLLGESSVAAAHFPLNGLVALESDEAGWHARWQLDAARTT
ncbi:MAG: histidine phosphatase family protein [Acidobacteria bacterium]|nr:histidine phosphatase family protein [Acidobacteriota bacterium]